MQAQGNVRLSIMGAGLIGVWVGGMMAAAGIPVVLIGRARLVDKVATHGLHLTDIDGADARLSAAQIAIATDASPAAASDVVIVTVKSADTAAAAADLSPHLAPGTCVVSLQNGVGNAEALAETLPQARVFAAMVPYNVAEPTPGHYHRGTGGAIILDADPALNALAAQMQAARLAVRRSDDMQGVLWGKLVINLNNAVNALSGKPLAAQLAERDYRRCWALCAREALDLLKQAGITPAQVLAIPAERLVTLLPLPDWIYRRIMARQNTRVDPRARSSMAEDLAAGRATEIAYLNGAVVALAQRLGQSAPINARMIALVRQAEAGAPPIAARDLYDALRSAARSSA